MSSKNKKLFNNSIFIGIILFLFYSFVTYVYLPYDLKNLSDKDEYTKITSKVSIETKNNFQNLYSFIKTNGTKITTNTFYKNLDLDSERFNVYNNNYYFRFKANMEYNAFEIIVDDVKLKDEKNLFEIFYYDEDYYLLNKSIVKTNNIKNIENTLNKMLIIYKKMLIDKINSIETKELKVIHEFMG